MRAIRTWVFLPLLAVVIMLALSESSVSARDHVLRENYSFDVLNVESCGVPVDVHVEGTIQATIHEWALEPTGPDSNAFWIGNIMNHGSEVHTNLETGEAVVVSWRDNLKEASFVDVGGGFWEYTFAENGIPFMIDQEVVDMGRIVITITLYLGDLTTGEDDYFVSDSASMIAGPHPIWDDDGYFCEVFLAHMND